MATVISLSLIYFYKFNDSFLKNRKNEKLYKINRAHTTSSQSLQSFVGPI